MPYAGGSGTVFHRFAQGFPASTEVQSLQPPGRGFRLREPPVRDFARMIESVLAVLRPRLDRPYALFGHSMGALVAFELVRALRREGRLLPLHLFVSAARAPAAWQAIPVSVDAEPLAFWRAVNQLYGTPVHGPVHPDVLTLAVPPLKADFALIASYRHSVEEPLTLPITAFVGTRDPMVRRDAALAWQAETSGPFALHEVAGPHLFLQDSAALVSAHVRAALQI
jgi:medium-chain acyl-[acyl-carrier-protein] hydrolase